MNCPIEHELQGFALRCGKLKLRLPRFARNDKLEFPLRYIVRRKNAEILGRLSLHPVVFLLEFPLRYIVRRKNAEIRAVQERRGLGAGSLLSVNDQAKT